MHAQTHGQTDNVKAVYPPQTKFAGGTIILRVRNTSLFRKIYLRPLKVINGQSHTFCTNMCGKIHQNTNGRKRVNEEMICINIVLFLIYTCIFINSNYSKTSKKTKNCFSRLTKINFCEPNSFMHMFNVSKLYRQSIKLFHQKL